MPDDNYFTPPSSAASRHLLPKGEGLLLARVTFFTLAAPAHADDKITYDNQVIAVFREHCLGCHNAEKKTGGLDLSSYAALSLGSSTGEIVSGGNADASTLLKVVSHQQQPFMPPNKPRIPDAHLAILQKWIETGLLE